MVPRFSLSARFVRDAVQHARSLHARSRARTLGFSRASTPSTERMPSAVFRLPAERYKRVTGKETCAVCRRTGLDSTCSFYGARVRRPVLRGYVMTSPWRRRRREIARGD